MKTFSSRWRKMVPPLIWGTLFVYCVHAIYRYEVKRYHWKKQKEEEKKLMEQKVLEQPPEVEEKRVVDGKQKDKETVKEDLKGLEALLKKIDEEKNVK
jgi:hypothetical protein